MTRLIVRTLLASVVGLGVLAGLARGQEPLVLMSQGPSAVAPGSHVKVDPNTVYGYAAPQAEPPANRQGLLHRLGRRVHNCPGNCYANHNTVGCSSLKSTLTFIFGSCHTFWGEPCYQNPLPPVQGAGYHR